MESSVASPRGRAFKGYALAVGSAALALALTLWVPPFAADAQIILFLLAIAVTAWYGGLRPALLATVLGVLAIGTIVRPPGRADVRAVDTLALLAAYLLAAALL